MFGTNDPVATLDKPTFGTGDKVVSFGHDDPIASESDVQPLNKTGDIISSQLSKAGIKTEDSTLTQLGKAAVGGINGYSDFMKKWVSDPLQEIPYSVANLLTLHHPDSPYARQLLKTSLLPESKSTSGNVATIADMVQHLPMPQNWKGEVQQRLMGAVPAGEEAVRGLVTPENLALAGTAAGIPAAARPITAAFLANTAAATPQAVNQAIQTEQNPQATQAEKGSADVNAAANIAFAALLAAHLGKGEAPRTDIPTTAERLEKDKTFGDVPLAQPHLPTDQIMDTRQALPETAGPSVPQQTRFQAGPPGAEAPIDRSQLSPQEQVELDRGPAPVYTPPKEKVMSTPIVGEQHPLQQPITDLTSAIADLKAQLEKGQIVPASQAVERARDVEGGQVSFGASAASEGIPNAQQSAIDTTSPKPVSEPISEPVSVPDTFDQQKAKLVAQLKAEPTMEGKQKVWKQIEGLKNSRPQESQQVEITLPGLRVKLNAAAKRRQAQGGGIDMSILEDVVKYGKTLYTKGMDQAAWTQEAVKKLGENVRPYVDEAYKYIAPSMQQRGDKLFGMQAEDVLRNPLDLKLKADTKGEFGSDKPKVPSVEQVQQRLQPKASIGKGIQAAVDKNKQAGSVTLPSKEEMGKALKTATETPKKILDTLVGHGVARPMSEIVDHFAAKQAGWSVPRHVSANEEVGNKLVRFAHADIAADEYAKALASEVLGDKHYKDKTFQDKLGKVIVEERLRALAKYHQGRDEADIADSVNHVMTPIEFNRALADPEIKAALKRHKDTLQPVAEEQHTALGGKLAATGPETGAFANLLAVTDADSFETAKQLIYRGKGNINPNAAIKGSVFDKRATGNAPKYETNYRTVAERMISGNYKRNALRNWIDSGVEAGLYKYGKAGEAPPEMGGQPMVSVPVKMKSTPWGSQTVKNLWVRKDLLPEVEQALSGGGKPMRAGLQHMLDLATTAQIIGPTDFVFHTANMFSSIVGSLGAKTVTADLARKITGVKQLDALGRIGYHLYRAILDHPDVQKELASLAQIGALRDQRVHEGPLGQFTTGRLIQLIDKAGRLARNQMFDNLVERKWVNDTELDRREFVNKMGQYNSKLMSKFQSTFQQYTSQFVVAGRTFNRNAFQRVLMSNEVRAANPSAYAKMKALNMIGVASTLIAIPIVVNSILTGHPFGRPGTPVGKIDTGKDDEKGRHILIDPAQSELMRRGLRNTGGQALFEGVRENKGVGETAKRMAGDVINGQLHPWMGPPVRIIQAYIEKRAETHDIGQSLKAALAAVNPTITAYFGMDERNPDRKGLAGVGKSLAGAIGVGTSRLPTHQEKVEATAAKYSMPLKTLDDRAEAERKMKQVSTPQTREELSKGAEYSIRADTKRGDLLEKAMDPDDRTFVQRRGLEIPGFSDKLHYAKSIVVLKPDEVERLQSRILAADKSMIAEFRQGYYDKETPEDQKLIFKKMITKGRERARKEMIEELMK